VLRLVFSAARRIAAVLPLIAVHQHQHRFAMQLLPVHRLLSEKVSWPDCTLARRLAAEQPLL
jgi:hypothetical protein